MESAIDQALDSVNLDQGQTQTLVTSHEDPDEAFWFAAACIHDNYADLGTLVCLSDVTHTSHLKKFLEKINDGRTPDVN